MAKFDPYKKPMSVQESEQLLRDADKYDATKAHFQSNLMIAGLLLFFVAIAAALWLGSILIGATAAGLIGFFLVMLWLWRQE
ncbi:replicase [Acidovorax phage AP1]|nr:replicase [Acidovorax phage AP1]